MTSREEVAKKLRKNSTAHSTEEAFKIICKCTIRAAKGSQGVIEVLADLIDPTCEGIHRREPDDIDGTPRYTIHCSNCGQLLDETSGIPHSPMYCLNCGTRIIRGCLYSQSEDSSEVVQD